MFNLELRARNLAGGVESLREHALEMAVLSATGPRDHELTALVHPHHRIALPVGCMSVHAELRAEGGWPRSYFWA